MRYCHLLTASNLSKTSICKYYNHISPTASLLWHHEFLVASKEPDWSVIITRNADANRQVTWKHNKICGYFHLNIEELKIEIVTLSHLLVLLGYADTCYVKVRTSKCNPNNLLHSTELITQLDTGVVFLLRKSDSRDFREHILVNFAEISPRVWQRCCPPVLQQNLSFVIEYVHRTRGCDMQHMIFAMHTL